MQLLYDVLHHKPNKKTNDELKKVSCKYRTKDYPSSKTKTTTTKNETF